MNDNKKYERILRRIRQRIFDYEDASPTKFVKAQRIMGKIKARLSPVWQAQSNARISERMLRLWS